LIGRATTKPYGYAGDFSIRHFRI